MDTNKNNEKKPPPNQQLLSSEKVVQQVQGGGGGAEHGPSTSGPTSSKRGGGASYNNHSRRKPATMKLNTNPGSNQSSSRSSSSKAPPNNDVNYSQALNSQRDHHHQQQRQKQSPRSQPPGRRVPPNKNQIPSLLYPSSSNFNNSSNPRPSSKSSSTLVKNLGQGPSRTPSKADKQSGSNHLRSLFESLTHVKEFVPGQAYTTTHPFPSTSGGQDPTAYNPQYLHENQVENYPGQYFQEPGNLYPNEFYYDPTFYNPYYNDQGNGYQKYKNNYREYREKERKKEEPEEKESTGEKNQKVTLEEDLRRGRLDCLVCFEKILSNSGNKGIKRRNDEIPIWTCISCYNIFHLKCIIQWGKKSTASISENPEEDRGASGGHLDFMGIPLPLRITSASTRRNNTNSPAITNWRCPSCQKIYQAIPTMEDYRCFCGKVQDPSWTRDMIPHSCGHSCGKRRSPLNTADSDMISCPHPCTAICHPGPCPPCGSFVQSTCPCGRSTTSVLCSNPFFVCDSVCDKVLEKCTLAAEGGPDHKCKKKCHKGSCTDCEVLFNLECHCGSEKDIRQEKCSDLKDALSASPPQVVLFNEKYMYSCGKICKKLLNCEIHFCEEFCHSGNCKPCKTSPELLLKCPCGRTTLESLGKKRLLCTDPVVETCGKICYKIMSDCGVNSFFSAPGRNSVHRCQLKCHDDLVPHTCVLMTVVKCKCGNQTYEKACSELNVNECTILCKSRCTKKRSCGKHKCNTLCCDMTEHLCFLICDKPLRCGLHKCSRLCGLHKCSPCSINSYEELRCECGKQVIYPPVPCGQIPPICNEPCSRTHPNLEICGHPVLHTCHTERECPPCLFLTRKFCWGKHQEMKNIPCSILGVSCGKPCSKILACNRHLCPRVCHPGSCNGKKEEGEEHICKLPCTKLRNFCGHPCMSVCHPPPCPDSKCKLTVEVTCPCGNRRDKMICCKREMEYQRLVDVAVKKQIQAQEEEAVAKIDWFEKQEDGSPEEDSSSSSANEREKTIRQELIQWKYNNRFGVLICDKECMRLSRVRKLAEALQIQDEDIPDDESLRKIRENDGSTNEYIRFGAPSYSEFMISMAKKNPNFCEMVHGKLREIVLDIQSREYNASAPGQNYVRFSFPSMNRDKRHLIHEYAEHFGCQSEAFDEEPNRNVAVAAFKDKCWLPTKSLIEVVFKK